MNAGTSTHARDSSMPQTLKWSPAITAWIYRFAHARMSSHGVDVLARRAANTTGPGEARPLRSVCTAFIRECELSNAGQLQRGFE